MIELYDRVVLKEDIREKKLQQGDVGTVAMVHGKNEGYEVEFFTLAGETYAVETLSADDVRPAKKNEVNHVRKLTH